MPHAQDDRATRLLRLLRDVLLVGALLTITSPWTSGLYTWFQQSRMAAAFDVGAAASSPPPASPATTRSAEASTGAASRHPQTSPFTAALAGWDTEDAASWKRMADGGAFARLTIPRIDVDITVVKGVSPEDLRRGPGWLPSTSLPGATGNVGISGHRTTWLAPFRRIDELRPGDTIRLRSRFRTYTYRVTGRTFVGPDDADVFLPTERPTLTLTACHPPYSNQFRIVVKAALVGVTRR